MLVKQCLCFLICCLCSNLTLGFYKFYLLKGTHSENIFKICSRAKPNQFLKPNQVLLEKAMATHSSILAWKILWKSLVGYSPWSHLESDTNERLHFHFSLSCIGEGKGKPLQCSCLENHRDRGGWWAAIYGVAQRQTQLKRLSSSSNQVL